MCSIPLMRTFGVLIVMMRYITSFYFIGAGYNFMSNPQLLRAYGSGLGFTGFILLLFGVFTLMVSFPWSYAVRRHNRFLLIVLFFADVGISIVLFGVAGALKNYGTPLFDKLLQRDCLKHKPDYHTPDQCADFYKSDRTAGYRLFWEGYFSDQSPQNVAEASVIIEGPGQCCGFFGPLNCVPNTKTFPWNLEPRGINPDLMSQRVKCGPVATYYPATSTCVSYSNILVNPPIVGGCVYDMGMGPCVNNIVQRYSIGCASQIEDYLSQQVLPHSYTIAGMVFLNILSAYISFTLFIKRKEHDVLPELYPEQNDPNRIDYKKVHDQFEVVPKPNFLINMGFVDRFKEERAVAAAQAAKAAEEAKAAEDEERKRLEEVERLRLAEEKKKKFMEESDSDSDDDDDEEEEAEGPKEGGGGDGSVANKSQGEGSAGKSQSGPEVVDLEAPFPPEKGLPKGPDEGSIASKNTKGSKGSKGSKNSKGSKGAETKGPKAKLKSSKVAIDGGDVEKGPAEG